MKTISMAVLFCVAVVGAASADDARVVARVGHVLIDDKGLGGLSSHESRLELQADGSLQGRGGDQIVVEHADGKIEVKLGRRAGMFTVKAENGLRTIDGEWGTGMPSYPVHIELDKNHLFMKWGFYERNMKPIQAPQLPEGCLRFARDDGGVAARWIDAMDMCGDSLSFSKAPSKELVTALLLSGFKKDPTGAMGAPLAELAR